MPSSAMAPWALGASAASTPFIVGIPYRGSSHGPQSAAPFRRPDRISGREDLPHRLVSDRLNQYPCPSCQ